MLKLDREGLEKSAASNFIHIPLNKSPLLNHSKLEICIIIIVVDNSLLNNTRISKNNNNCNSSNSNKNSGNGSSFIKIWRYGKTYIRIDIYKVQK
jgi:hypothetical protein